jgi:hypothetical protein
MRSKLVYGLSAVAMATLFSLAFGYGGMSEYGPLASSTGAPAIRAKPAEWNCTLCHLNFSWNNLNTPGGAVEILDLPATYVAGETYRLRVRLSTDSTASFPEREWGFQITAVRASDGEGCGTFVLDVADADSLQIVSGTESGIPELASRWYVEHKFAGVRHDVAGSAEWTFSWRAPDAPEDTVLFYCAGNAGNGDMSPDGDFIFTAADTVLDQATPVLPVSWGAVKRRYR